MDVYKEINQASLKGNLDDANIKAILTNKLSEIDRKVESSVKKMDEIFGNGGNGIKQLITYGGNSTQIKSQIKKSLMNGVLKDIKKQTKMSKYSFIGRWQRNILRDDLLARIRNRILNAKSKSRKKI